MITTLCVRPLPTGATQTHRENSISSSVYVVVVHVSQQPQFVIGEISNHHQPPHSINHLKDPDRTIRLLMGLWILCDPTHSIP